MQFLAISSTLSYHLYTHLYFLDYVAHNLVLHFRIRFHYVVSCCEFFMQLNLIHGLLACQLTQSMLNHINVKL
jgi:hypothetical protein